MDSAFTQFHDFVYINSTTKPFSVLESMNSSTSFDPKRQTHDQEQGHRRQGRPPGSKNKPKLPFVITNDDQNTFQCHVFEIAAAADIADSISNYARRRHRGLSILSAAGSVANVTLHQPSATAGAITLHDCFDILSLSGAFLPPSSPQTAFGLTVFLAGSQGRVVGGLVSGPLIAAGPVIVIAASFSKAVYERLPMEEEKREMELEDDMMVI